MANWQLTIQNYFKLVVIHMVMLEVSRHLYLSC